MTAVPAAFLAAAGLCAGAGEPGPSGAPPALEVRISALVEARSPAWPEVDPEAVIDTGALSWRRKVFLGSSREIPVRSREVERALADALAVLPPGTRSRTFKVLDAIGKWVSASIAEDAGPLGTPSSWRPADEVIGSGHGNAFERVRVMTAMLRAAGIPAKPSFNGVPMAVIFTAAPRDPGAWTVWDPLHPSGSFRWLPVGWLPLRGGEVPLVSSSPEGAPCTPAVEVRRWAGREEVSRAWETVGRLGAFPSNPVEPLAAGTAAWWEIWITTLVLDPDPGAVTLRVPLPFVPELRTGTRDQSVWLSDPKRLRSTEQWSETDQRVGGLVHGLSVRISAPPRGGGS